MTREPRRVLRLKDCGSMTASGFVAVLTARFDQFLADNRRLLETKLLAALEAGELTDVESIDAALDAAAQMDIESRVAYRRTVLLELHELHSRPWSVDSE